MKRILSLSCLLLTFVALPLRAVDGQPTMPQRLGVIIVVDGAGGWSTVYDHLGEILPKAKLPLARASIRWGRWGEPPLDHKDFDAQMEAADRLAGYITAYRAKFPHEKIYLMGQSTGPHIILAALSMLPPDTVDHVAITAPMVSFNYDLRPALLATRTGIDVWFSTEDDLAVRVCEYHGTADRRRDVQCAGERGFAVPPIGHPDAPLFLKKLKQYRWDSSWEAVGHTGGHFGFSRALFLAKYVLPTMLITDVMSTKGGLAALAEIYR